MILVANTLDSAIDLDIFHVVVIHLNVDETSSMASLGTSMAYSSVLVHDAYTMMSNGAVNPKAMDNLVECMSKRYSEVVIGHYFPTGVDEALFSENGLMGHFDKYQGSNKHVTIVSMEGIDD